MISQNLLGIGIYTPVAYPSGTPSDILVVDNLIGTDSTGQQGFGNANEGVLIDNSSNNTIQGNSSGSQVISGNQVGVELNGAQSTGNLLEGNFIGSDKTGFADLGNKNQGVLIEGAVDNTIGGTQATSRNLISANHWGVQLDGASATGNVIEGNYIGTDASGTARLGNEVDGVIISNSASSNTIGGAIADQGNIIAFQVMSGVLVESGTGDSILSNSIFGNGMLGIDLVAAEPIAEPNAGPQQPPELPGPDRGHVERVSHSHPGHAEQPAQHLVPDPVLHQPDGRSERVRPGTDRIRFNPGDYRWQRQRHDQCPLRLGFPAGCRAVGNRDQPDDRRHLRIRI